MEAPRASPHTSASTGRPRVGWESPAERRRLRSLRCCPGSARMPSRSPGGGRFCARGPLYISWAVVHLVASSSLMTLADFCPREEWCVASATAIATATRSCRNMERMRRSLRRRALPVPPPASRSTSIVNRWDKQKGFTKGNATCLNLWVVVVVAVVVVVVVVVVRTVCTWKISVDEP